MSTATEWFYSIQFYVKFLLRDKWNETKRNDASFPSCCFGMLLTQSLTHSLYLSISLSFLLFCCLSPWSLQQRQQPNPFVSRSLEKLTVLAKSSIHEQKVMMVPIVVCYPIFSLFNNFFFLNLNQRLFLLLSNFIILPSAFHIKILKKFSLAKN